MDDVAERVWQRFRDWPALAQVVSWIVVPFVLAIILVWQARWDGGAKVAATGALVVAPVFVLMTYLPDTDRPDALAPSPSASPTTPTFSEITLTRVELMDEAVVVEGQTDLPETSVLTIGLADEAGKVASSTETVVRNGQFAAGLQPPQTDGIDEGLSEEPTVSFDVEVTFSPASQPLDVLLLVGPTGENLKGPLVATDADFVVLHLRQRVGIVAAPSPSAS